MSKYRGALAAGFAALALAVGAGGAAVAAPAPRAPAAKAGSLPESCMVTIGETTRESYFYENKVSLWSPVALPKGGARFAEFRSPRDDESIHYLAVTSAGLVYDSSVSVGVFGDWGNLKMLDRRLEPAGSTIRGIVDLEVGTEELDDGERRAAKTAYAVTADGKLHAIPMSFVKGRVRLGAPVTLTAKGLSGLRGIESQGRYWANGKVNKHLLLGHTKDGRLVELTVTRGAKKPTLSYKVVAKGWQNVSALALGWCHDENLEATTVIVSVHSDKRVTARLDPVWNDASLRGAKTIQLAPWKHGSLSNLF